MRLANLTLCTAAMLAGCTNLPQIASLVSAGTTLATVAAKYNTTAANLVTQGNLICGKIDSATGHLIEGSVEAVATVAGVPAAVTNAAANDVAAACPVGLSPGALPASVSPASVPVVATAAASVLPPAS